MFRASDDGLGSNIVSGCHEQLALTGDARDLGLFFKWGTTYERSKLLAEVVNRPASTVAPDPATDNLIETFLGPVPALTLGKGVEALMLQTTRWTSGRDVLALAAAVHFCARAWISAFTLRLSALLKGPLEAVACYRFLLSDETTLVSGQHRWQGEVEHTERGPLKMVQSECTIGFLVRERSSGMYHFWTIPVVVPLQAADKNTGETMYALWSDILKMLFGDVADQFPVIFDCRTLDRAGSNLRAVRKFESVAIPRQICLTFSCDAHGISSVTGRVFEPVQGMVTGMIAFSMCLKMGGHFTSFVRQLRSIISQSVVVVDAPPLPPVHPWCKHRDGLLSLLLPATSERRIILCDLLTGDIRGPTIELRRPGGATPAEVETFASDLANQLMPAQLETFSRTRWLGATKPIADAALLGNVHQLLSRTVLAWTSTKLGGPVDKPVVDLDWDVVQSDSENEDKPEEGPKYSASRSPDDWTAWNRKQQRTSRRFALGRPEGVTMPKTSCSFWFEA